MILHLLIGHLNIIVAEYVIWNQVLSIFVHLNAAPLYLCVCVQITIIVIIMNNDDKDTDIHAPHLMVAQSTYTLRKTKNTVTSIKGKFTKSAQLCTTVLSHNDTIQLNLSCVTGHGECTPGSK